MQFNVIILAGGERGPLYETTGCEEKALLPIHGTPMVSRVIETFADSEQTEHLCVVGSSKLDALASMSLVRKRLFTGLNVVQNLLHAVTYVKHRLTAGASDHNGYVVTFCDAVFLTTPIVDATLATIAESDADVVLHYVRRSSFVAADLPTRRTWLPVAGMYLTGGTIYYVRRFHKVFTLLPRLLQLRQHRKDPAKFLELLGCDADMDLRTIEDTLAERLGLSIEIAVSPHPELGMDVDKPDDLELATRLVRPKPSEVA